MLRIREPRVACPNGFEAPRSIDLNVGPGGRPVYGCAVGAGVAAA